ncbi:MAG: phosphatase [Planctomycetota bacterium]|nr:MAG: phosphatase [Planctomycetota bacterium]
MPSAASASAIELHAHSSCSDGLLAPGALVELAHRRGLRALAITDHDTIAALSLAAGPARELGVELVHGVEISAAHAGAEVHLLGYLFDPAAEPLLRLLEQQAAARRARFEQMLERLGAAGVRLDARALLASAATNPGRLHLARLLVQAGVVASIPEAFRRYLGAGAACYVPKPLPPVEQAIAAVRAAGGVAVLAHPGRYRQRPRTAALVAAGLGGIEVYYPSHTPEEVASWLAEAARYRLVVTGGSDFHGDPDRPELGSQPLPADVLEQLRAAACRRRPG